LRWSFAFPSTKALLVPLPESGQRDENWPFGFGRNNGKSTIKLSHKINEEFDFQIELSAKIFDSTPLFALRSRILAPSFARKGEFVMSFKRQRLRQHDLICLFGEAPSVIRTRDLLITSQSLWTS
jgi:hypothetical protein